MEEELPEACVQSDQQGLQQPIHDPTIDGSLLSITEAVSSAGASVDKAPNELTKSVEGQPSRSLESRGPDVGSDKVDLRSITEQVEAIQEATVAAIAHARSAIAIDDTEQPHVLDSTPAVTDDHSAGDNFVSAGVDSARLTPRLGSSSGPDLHEDVTRATAGVERTTESAASASALVKDCKYFH